MAKKPGRAQMTGFYKGNVDESLNLATLAAATLVSTNFDESTNHSALMTSIRGVYAVNGLTVGDGPLEVGIAMSDYSSAEIEAVIELTAGSWGVQNLTAREVANRLVRRIGLFGTDAVSNVLNDGKPIRTKLNWRIPEGDTLKLWAYNHGGGALNTGAVIRANGHVNLKNIP